MPHESVRVNRPAMISLLATAFLAIGGAPIDAMNQLVPGTKLAVKAARAKENVKFASKGRFTLPNFQSPDDPTLGGATFQLLNPATGESFTFDLPRSHWRLSPRGTFYRYRDPSLTQPHKVVGAIIGGRTLKVSTRKTGITLNESAQVELGVVLQSGSVRYCARLDDGFVTKDEPGRFTGKNAPAPSSCPAPTSTTTTVVAVTTTSIPIPTSTTTSTTTVPTCGGIFPLCSGTCPVGQTCTGTFGGGCACQ